MKEYRNKKYITWIKTLPCVISGLPADDPHHIIGHGMGGMGTTASDLFAMPMCRAVHARLHSMSHKDWEAENGSQWTFVRWTLAAAIRDGVIDPEIVLSEIDGQIKDESIKNYLKEIL